MKQTILTLLSAMMMPMAAMAANDDPIVMTVGTQTVTRSEFEYSYKKNNGPEVLERKSVADYVPLFINYKRKVLAALDAKLDTLSSFNKEFRQYRDQLVMPTFVTDNDVEQQARQMYEAEKARIGADGLVNTQHILIRVGQNDTDEVMKQAKLRADSIYNALLKGADFAELAKSLSQDPGSAQRGGEIGFISRGQTLKAYDEAAFSLKEGELSKPVQTEVGYHIIKMKQRKQLESYDSLRNDILQFIERRNLRDALAKNRLKDLASVHKVSQEEYMDQRADSIAAADPAMKYLIKEYYEGLLLFEVSNRQVWEPASKDEEALQAYFKKNRKNYKWDQPVFKGVAYHAREVADIEAVKKALKGKPFAEWTETLRTFNTDSLMRIRAEKGLFKKGDNGLVDRNAFGVKDAEFKAPEGFDHPATFGKTLKAPEELSDVRQLVQGDYQGMLEEQWLKELEARYPATINDEVIATIKSVTE